MLYFATFRTTQILLSKIRLLDLWSFWVFVRLRRISVISIIKLETSNTFCEVQRLSATCLNKTKKGHQKENSFEKSIGSGSYPRKPKRKEKRRRDILKKMDSLWTITSALNKFWWNIMKEKSLMTIINWCCLIGIRKKKKIMVNLNLKVLKMKLLALMKVHFMVREILESKSLNNMIRLTG